MYQQLKLEFSYLPLGGGCRDRDNHDGCLGQELLQHLVVLGPEHVVAQLLGGLQVVHGLNYQRLQLWESFRVSVLGKLVDQADFVINLGCQIIGFNNQNVLRVGFDGSGQVLSKSYG